MAAIGGAAPLARALVNQPVQMPLGGTTEKVKQFMSRLEGIATVFTILAGAAAAALWGVKFGLLSAAIGGLVILAVSLCRSRQAPPRVQLDPAQQLQPNPMDFRAARMRPEDPAAGERHMANIQQLMHFVGNIQKEIFMKSPHFDNMGNLFTFLRDEFWRVDFSRATLHSAEPVRFNENVEGYEITIRSEAPQGWIRLYLPKENRPLFVNIRNLQQIDQVAPFLDKYVSEGNHFATFGLPFLETGNLRLAFIVENPQMDLTQVQFVSMRNVRFEHVYRPMGGEFVAGIHAYEGYELNFQTPNGLVRYYVSPQGESVARPEDAQNIVPR